jgi:hypothetical protein
VAVARSWAQKFVGRSTRRARGVPGIVLGVAGSERLHFRVDIDRASTPVTGDVQLDGTAPRSFTGWTELFVAFEQAIADAAAAYDSAGPDRALKLTDIDKTEEDV